ncbi:MAG: hypothetical protein ACXWWX_05925, partial [Actinomycetota bacterium]
PEGWEARIWVPDLPAPALNLPVITLSNAVLSDARTTYAAEESERLPRSKVMVSLVEFDETLADVGLYAPQGVPGPFTEDDLDPRALQRARRGRSGLQRFFSVNGRAFSLYVIARDGPALARTLGKLHQALTSLVVGTVAERRSSEAGA